METFRIRVYAAHSASTLLRAPPRPRSRAAEQRDERTSLQLIELHSIPASQGRIAGYRIGEDQSGGNRDQKRFRQQIGFGLGPQAFINRTLHAIHDALRRCGVFLTLCMACIPGPRPSRGPGPMIT